MIKQKSPIKTLSDKKKIPKGWLTLEQVSEYLQIPLDELQAYYRQMPGKIIFGKWRIQKDKLDEWIDSQTTEVDLEHEPKMTNQEPDKQSETLASESTGSIQIMGGDTKTPEKVRGVIKRFFFDYGYGFIGAEDGRDVFVHVTDIKNQEQSFESGDEVEFEIVHESGGPVAKNVIILAEKIRGTIKAFFPEKGYGFIEAEDGRNVFVHITDIKNQEQSLMKGDEVEFRIVRKDEGWAARNVAIISISRAERFYQQALVEIDKGNILNARTLFKKAMSFDPQPDMLRSYATMEEKEGQTEKALQILQEGIRMFPSEGILYKQYAMCLRKRSDLKKAEEILKEGLAKAPDFAKQLHLGLAIVLAEIEDNQSLQEAFYHAEQAQKLGILPEAAMPKRTHNKLRLVTGPGLGREAWDFLKKAGFSIWVEDFTDDYADFLVTSKHVEYTESYDLQGRILARCFFSDIQWKDIDGLLQHVRKPPKPYCKINLNNDIGFIILNDATPWEDALYRLIEKNREVIIPFDSGIFLKSKEEKIIDIFRGVMDKWMSHRDLFDEKIPVSGRRFFGREAELQNLMRNIDDGEHTGIYGLRKVGKTSLLYQLREKRPEDLVIYIDLQRLPVKDCAFLYWKIARGLQEAITEKKVSEVVTKDVSLKLGAAADYEDLENPEEKNALRFDRDVSCLLEMLAADEKTVSSKIVLTIDELEEMLPVAGRTGFKGYAEFFAHLRGITQDTQNKLVTIVTAANSAISEQGTWEGRDNPVFQFYKEMFLPPLVQQECHEMIEKLGRGMNVSFDSESLEHIYSETGGHPYITRQFCSHITSQHPSRPLGVDSQLVTSNIELFIRDKGYIFKEILDRLDSFPEEKALFELIAEVEPGESELSSLVSEPIDEALRHLIGYQIIKYKEGKYHIKINLLHRWLKRFRPR